MVKIGQGSGVVQRPVTVAAIKHVDGFDDGAKTDLQSRRIRASRQDGGNNPRFDFEAPGGQPGLDLRWNRQGAGFLTLPVVAKRVGSPPAPIFACTL